MGNKTIDELVEKVREAEASERNRRKSKSRPWVGVGLEDPIASAILLGIDPPRYFSDPAYYLELALRQKLWRWENIDDDNPINLEMPAWLGYYPEYTFLGMDVYFNDRGVPIIQEDHPLTRDPDLKLLEPVDFATSGWMPRALRWYEDLTSISAGRINISFIRWDRGCLDLAVQLRGFGNFVTDTMERPQFIHDLMKFLVEQRNRWHDECCRHFGTELQPTFVADDWINVPFISPQIFADFVLPRYLEIEAHHGGITGIHSCGNQAPVQRYLLEIKSLDMFEVSPWTDLTQALSNIPADKRLGIALHPNDVLVAAPEEMEAKLRFIAESCQERSYVVGTSGLTPIFDDNREFTRRIRLWLDIARRVFGQYTGEGKSVREPESARPQQVA